MVSRPPLPWTAHPLLTFPVAELETHERGAQGEQAGETSQWEPQEDTLSLGRGPGLPEKIKATRPGPPGSYLLTLRLSLPLPHFHPCSRASDPPAFIPSPAGQCAAHSRCQQKSSYSHISLVLLGHVLIYRQFSTRIPMMKRTGRCNSYSTC